MSGTGLYEFVLPDKVDLEKTVFLGTVIANNDPLKLGRVQVTIDQLYDNVAQADLPWAIPFLNPSLGATQTAGFFGIPDVGSSLSITMLNGDPKFPVYKAALWTTENTKAESLTNYPNRYGFRDATGNVFIVDKTAGTVTFTHHTGSIVEFDNSGDIQITSNKDTDVTTENGGNFNLTIAGNVVANVTGNINATVDGSLTANVSGTTNVTSTGTAIWNVPAGLTINGNLTLNGVMTATTVGGGAGTITAQGTITSNTDVVTGSISLMNHVHGGVSTGGSDTGPPV